MSSSKTAVVVLSDPQGGEEALGRLFNALAATYDFKQKQPRRPTDLPGNRDPVDGAADQYRPPRPRAYEAVADKVAGVSSACSDFFGARRQAEQNGFSLLSTNAVPGNVRASEPRDVRRGRLHDSDVLSAPFT
jgi:hypothetical protein